MPEDASRLRQRLLRAGEQHQRQLELLLAERGPFIRGTFGTRHVRCGYSGCCCHRGEPHIATYLSATDHGKTRQVHIPASDRIEVQEGVTRYARFREAHARLNELVGEQLELVDELGRSLLKPFPPDNPFPPPHHRGKRPVKRKRDGP